MEHCLVLIGWCSWGRCGETESLDLKGYLWAHDLGAKDFGDPAEQMSKRVKEAALAPMLAANRPCLRLNSGKDDKQKIALQIAARDEAREGPILRLECCRVVEQLASDQSRRVQHQWLSQQGPASPSLSQPTKNQTGAPQTFRRY